MHINECDWHPYCIMPFAGCARPQCQDKMQVPFTPVYVYADGIYSVIIHRMLVLYILTFWLSLKVDGTVIELNGTE